jgi:hypothetical protein
LFQCTVVVLIIAFCAFGQFAIAQNKPHTHMMVVPRTPSDVHSDALPPTAGIYAVTQGFVGTPYPNWVQNSNGAELWPCFGSYNGTATSTENVDCPTVGSPTIGFTAGGGVFGTPSYTWPLATSTSSTGYTTYGCDGTTNGTQNPYAQGETWDPAAINTFYIPCGQINTWYEDWTGDSTDEILWNAEVTQVQSGVTKVLADTGIQDWGPNAYGDVSVYGQPVDVVFYQDFNFGGLGDTGKNNGNCVPNFDYPIPQVSGAPSPSYPLIEAAGKTCGEPKTGIATITVTTELGTPTYTLVTTAKGCAPTAPPCYTVKYTVTTPHKISQKWDIYLH